MQSLQQLESTNQQQIEYDGYTGVCSEKRANGNCYYTWTLDGEQVYGLDSPDYLYNYAGIYLNNYQYNEDGDISFTIEVDPYFYTYLSGGNSDYNYPQDLVITPTYTNNYYQTITLPSQDLNNITYGDISYLTWTIPAADINTSLNMNIEINVQGTYLSSIGSPFTDPSYDDYIVLPTKQSTTSDITLSSPQQSATYNETISSTTPQNGTETNKDQTLTITNDTPNITTYPENFTNIISLQYNDELNNSTLSLPSTQTIYIDDIKGYNTISSITGEWVESLPNTYTLEVDENLYYDSETEQVVQGVSTTYPTSQNSFIMPWDYSSNYGYLYIPISLSSYGNWKIDLTIPIGTTYALRGNNSSEYYFTNNISNFNSATFNTTNSYKLSGSELQKSNYTYEEIEQLQ